jgi:two-component system response regulator RegA
LGSEDQPDGESEETKNLLIVEDDQRFADTLSAEFRDRGYAVEWLESLQAVKDHPTLDFRYAVVDLRIRQDSGLDVITTLKERSPDMVVIVLTGYGSIATAVKATKLGATAYLTKPVEAEEIERAFLGEETDEDIPIPDEFQSLYRHEREYIEYVLAECDGNISQAARRLGLHRQSLQRKLRKYTPN